MLLVKNNGIIIPWLNFLAHTVADLYTGMALSFFLGAADLSSVIYVF